MAEKVHESYQRHSFSRISCLKAFRKPTRIVIIASSKPHAGVARWQVGCPVQNHERRSRLLDIIRVRGFAALDELVRELGVSESTIRRDLDALEEQGAARRTHGGVLYSGGMPRLAEFDERQPANWAAKRAIAAAAAELIEDGETVLLDGGTTTYEVARLLVGRSLQVVTNSLPVANLFASEARTDLVLLGGYVSPRTGVCLGPYANELLGRLHVTTTVLSAAGIAEEGLFNAHLLLAETEQAMLKAASRVMVVADSSKFGRKSLTLVSTLDAIDTLVSDDAMPQAWRDVVARARARVVIAAVPDQDDRPAALRGATPPDRARPA
jgi:DeoR/GlpR family transcriptional regulator of sugar metabolism